jgi:hypothetical protein
MITSEVMRLLLDKYDNFMLKNTYLQEDCVRIYQLVLDDENKIKCKVCYRNNHTKEVVEI